MIQNLELVLVSEIGSVMRSNVTINQCGLDQLFMSASEHITSDGRGEEIPQLEVQIFQISGIDPGFFRYIYEGTQISTS